MDKAYLIKKLKDAFNDFMNIDSTTYEMVQDELFLIELKGEPKNLVLNKFIRSVLEIN